MLAAVAIRISQNPDQAGDQLQQAEAGAVIRGQQGLQQILKNLVHQRYLLGLRDFGHEVQKVFTVGARILQVFLKEVENEIAEQGLLSGKKQRSAIVHKLAHKLRADGEKHTGII